MNPSSFMLIAGEASGNTRAAELVIPLRQKAVAGSLDFTADAKPLHAVFERQIAATDRQIDHLVYDLYGLTEDEIAIAEGKVVTETSVAPGAEAIEPAAKPKRTRRKSPYARPPVAPVDGSLMPEKGYSDAAHHYGIGKEEAPPYRMEEETP